MKEGASSAQGYSHAGLVPEPTLEGDRHLLHLLQPTLNTFPSPLLCNERLRGRRGVAGGVMVLGGDGLRVVGAARRRGQVTRVSERERGGKDIREGRPARGGGVAGEEGGAVLEDAGEVLGVLALLHALRRLEPLLLARGHGRGRQWFHLVGGGRGGRGVGVGREAAEQRDGGVREEGAEVEDKLVVAEGRAHARREHVGERLGEKGNVRVP